MNELKRHQMVYKLLCPAVRVFTKWKFNYEYDSLSEIEGPYLLLANHNLELDPLLIGVAVNKHLYFVASEHITRKGLASWLLMRYLKPIIHKKGRQGVYTVKEMLKTLKSGISVCIYPEGNRSFNGVTGEMMPAIGKVARKSGAKLVTYRVEGGYLTQPRWSKTLRKGKLKGRLIHVYSLEELKGMTDEQVNDAICRDLYEDAYVTQKQERIAFKGKDLALGMETTVFCCPDCGKIGTLRSEKNHVFCSCGFRAEYDVYGELTDTNSRKYTLTELDELQRKTLEAMVEAHQGEEPLFTDEVMLYEIDNHHQCTGTKQGTLSAYTDRFECCGHVLSFDSMQGVAIYSRNSMVLHQEGLEGHLEVKSGDHFSALKYLYLYNMKKKGQ